MATFTDMEKNIFLQSANIQAGNTSTLKEAGNNAWSGWSKARLTCCFLQNIPRSGRNHFCSAIHSAASILSHCWQGKIIRTYIMVILTITTVLKSEWLPKAIWIRYLKKRRRRRDFPMSLFILNAWSICRQRWKIKKSMPSSTAICLSKRDRNCCFAPNLFRPIS